jgi:hypothetical protein
VSFSNNDFNWQKERLGSHPKSSQKDTIRIRWDAVLAGYGWHVLMVMEEKEESRLSRFSRFSQILLM